MNKTLTSLKILSVLNMQIQKHFETLAELSRGVDSPNKWLFYIVRCLVIIQTVSYLDEWDNFFGHKTEIEDQEHLIKLKSLVNPAIKRIRKWKDLKKFRNCILAHNLRNREGIFVFLDASFDHSDIPNNIYEFEVLAKCLDIATLIVCTPYQPDLEKYSKSLPNEEERGIPLIIDPEKEIDEIKKQITDKLKF